MPEIIKNLFKASGIFKCHHPMHRPFEYKVSPYHILKVKNCYPQGCVEFKWRCYNFEKGKKCPRNFKHVGRECFSCNKYHENKETYSPETTMSSKELKRFIEDYHVFESWCDEMRGKRVRFSGQVKSIRPHLRMEIDSRRNRVSLNGYFASFDKGYLENDLFNDKIYLRLSKNILERTKLADGDEIEADVLFTEDRGRFILRQPRGIDIDKNNSKPQITVSSSLIARSTGKIIDGAIKHCHGCKFCALIDIEDLSRKRISYYRRFYCLKGVSDNENCPVRLEGIMDDYKNNRNDRKRF